MQDLYRLKYDELLDYAKLAGGFVVVYRPIGGIGDAVMVLPAISALREEWGDEMPIVVLCIDYVEAIFRHHPDVSAVVSVSHKEIESTAITKAFELMEADCILYPLYHPCPASMYENSHNPEIVRSRQEIFATACDVTFSGDGYKLYAKEGDQDILGKMGIGDRYILVNVRSHDIWRDYPRILMRALLSKLVRWGKRRDIQIVSVDSVLDYRVPGVTAVHNYHLDSILGLASKALMVIGPDSSIVHIGGAMGRSILGIFGPTDPSVRLVYPHAYSVGEYTRCKRQYCWYTPCKNKFCLKTLPPSRIVKAAEEILAERGEL